MASNSNPNRPEPGHARTRLELLLEFLEEDAGEGDVTTLSLGIQARCKSNVTAKRRCVIAGLEAVRSLLDYFEVSYDYRKSDGEFCEAGETVMELEGDGAVILKLERLILNVISLMSGIATATREIVDKVTKVNPDCIIAATRKTTPGFRLFEKDAVVLGGGHPHRFDLAESVLIKDNHLSFFGKPEEALDQATAYVKNLNVTEPQTLKYGIGEPAHGPKWIEMEADTFEAASAALKAGADIIMLDNMTPDEAERAYKMLKKMRKEIKIEISGGITPDNILDYAKSADIISLGWLTHSAPAADFSMTIVKVLE
jgi:nicotinate-nucleotide pyrophosphorylase (carboxylating)